MFHLMALSYAVTLMTISFDDGDPEPNEDFDVTYTFVDIPVPPSIAAVMWITCQSNPQMLRFDIARSSNLRPTSHGLLGKNTNCLTASLF